jgi:hypothetical protein
MCEVTMSLTIYTDFGDRVDREINRQGALEKNENEVDGKCSENKSQKSESNLTDAVGSLGPHGSRINGITAFRGKKNDKAETRNVAQHVG